MFPLKSTNESTGLFVHQYQIPNAFQSRLPILVANFHNQPLLQNNRIMIEVSEKHAKESFGFKKKEKKEG